MDNRRLTTPLILISLFAAAWIPRLLVLDAFVTADERKWLNRSGNFYWALSQGEWAETFQKAHPGVTVTWAGLFAFLQAFPDYLQRVSGPITDHALETMLWAERPLTPLALLAVGRWWVILGVALAVAVLYLPLRKLYGELTAIVAALFVAWSPFFLGLSHHLHPDGLLAAFCALATLLFLAWLYAGRQWRYLISSALVFGLALLTKTPAVAVGLTAGLLVLLESLRQWRKGQGGQPRLWTGAALWALIALLTFVALWPVMWVDPLGALGQIYGQMQGYRVEGHSLPSYFMGQIVDDPGLLFYPAVLFLRVSPVTLLGLLLALWAVIRRYPPLDEAKARWATLGCALFALIFTLLMVVAVKKFDRYILPVFLMFDVVAAAGWVGLLAHLTRMWQFNKDVDRPSHVGLSRALAATVLAMLVVGQGLPAFQQYPYYALAFNPLVGGSRTAAHFLMIGWGEGLDRAGRWLAQQPSDGPLRVVSWYEDGPLSYYLPGDSQVMSFIESDNYWFDADYVVLYANQWQRENPDPEMIAHFLNRTPDFSAEVNGLELAKVYDVRNEPPPPFTHIQTDSRADFDGWVRLAAYRLPKPSVVPGDSLDITLYLKAIAPVEVDYSARMALLDPGGAVIWQEERWPSGMGTAGWPLDQIRQDRYRAPLPADARLGRYTFEFALIDPATGEALAVQPISGAAASSGPYPVAAIDVQAPEPIEIGARWTPVAITQLAHAPAIQPGQTLLVDIAADGAYDGSTKLSLRLVDPAGKTQAQQDKDLEADLRFELAVPPGLAAGEYSLSMVVYDGETLQAYPDQDGRSPTELSTVQVQP